MMHKWHGGPRPWGPWACSFIYFLITYCIYLTTIFCYQTCQVDRQFPLFSDKVSNKVYTWELRPERESCSLSPNGCVLASGKMMSIDWCSLVPIPSFAGWMFSFLWNSFLCCAALVSMGATSWFLLLLTVFVSSFSVCCLSIHLDRVRSRSSRVSSLLKNELWSHLPVVHYNQSVPSLYLRRFLLWLPLHIPAPLHSAQVP